MQWEERIANYVRVTGFPRSLFLSEDGRVVGTWIMGNDYRVKSAYYGGYPAGYLRRIRALFPDKCRVLHLFSGKVDLDALPGDTVDINAAMNPTFVDDAQTLRNVPLADYDLILADPPYSIEDAERYRTTMVKRNTVLRALARVSAGAHVVWLDQVLPMYRKDVFSIEAVIGMVKSTNHRFRVVTVFRRMASIDARHCGRLWRGRGESIQGSTVPGSAPLTQPLLPLAGGEGDKERRAPADFPLLRLRGRG